MTVNELIKALGKLPPDAMVVMSRDAEGNGFSPLYEAAMGTYLAENEWSGDLIHPDDAGDYDDLETVVCLWPTN